MDYKVEQKPTLWEVILERGSYSDHEEQHLFFAGNDENEIWNFLCRYFDSTTDKYCNLTESRQYCSCESLSYGELYFSPTSCKSTKHPPNDYWYQYDVEIKRLNVIYFAK